MVEFALISTLVVTLIFAIIEFGLVFNDYLELRSASREGARMAVVNYPCNPAPATCSTSGAAQLTTLIQAIQNRAAGLGTAANVTVDVGLPSSADVGGYTTVCLKYTYKAQTGFFPFLNNLVLHSSAIMRLEQKPTFNSTFTSSGGSCP